jgi:hypothetical protein
MSHFTSEAVFCATCSPLDGLSSRMRCTGVGVDGALLLLVHVRRLT